MQKNYKPMGNESQQLLRRLLWLPSLSIQESVHILFYEIDLAFNTWTTFDFLFKSKYTTYRN